MSRGAFIVIEGIDKCGKTSQTKKLVETLKIKSIIAERMSFPDRSTCTGQIISKYLGRDCKLNDQSIHLLFSANRWENVEKIKEQLYKGITLIVDRYLYSGIAYSVAKGMDFNWCIQPEVGLPKPDLVLFLNIDINSQAMRSDFGRERYETTEMQTKVAKIFQQFADIEDNWQVIDANASFDTVHANLKQTIERVLNDIKVHKKHLQYFNLIGSYLSCKSSLEN